MATRFDPNAPLRVSGRREPEQQRPEIDQEQALHSEKMKQKLEELVGRLTTLAQDQVAKKNTVEERWLKDLRQYHGRYDAKTETTLVEGKKSRLYVNQTRPKTHAWEGKLSDMLFPADGTKNWGIRATPVPELQQVLAQGQPDDENIQGNGAQQAAPVSAEAEEAANIIAQAKIGAKAMEREIDDQLREAKYDIKMRLVLHDACKMGAGISKGPTLTNKMRRQWKNVTGDNGKIERVLAEVQDPRPDNSRVDPWSFFPDMSAVTMEDAGFAFERHLMKAKDIRALAKQPGFDHDELRKLLDESPHEGYPTYVTLLREITGAGQDMLKERFHVWEYHGPIEREDLEAILDSTDQADLLDEYDPLEEINVIVWFCQGHLLKFAEQPMESGDYLYSVFSFEKDDTSMFGFGVPYLMRDSQSAINGAWRMTMDNGGLSAKPMVLIDQSIVEPADGEWTLTAGKVWLQKSALANPGAGKPFDLFNITNNQQELTNIIEMALRFADDETSLPVVDQRGGENNASHVIRSAMGMAMLMNAANVVFRRVVKNFDDQMTVPNLVRMYDWNMQFNPKDSIKGDYEVDARGSSVLLVREIQSQNLMVMASTFTSHPVLGPLTKAAPLYRKLVEAHMLSPNDIVLTDDEIQVAQRKKAEEGEQDPEKLKLAMKFEIAQMETGSRKEIALIERDTKMFGVAEQNNMSVERLKALFGIKQMETDSKERMLAVEAALEARKDATGDTSGSGGFLS